MTSVPLEPVTINSATLMIDSDNYEAAIGSAIFTPSTKSSSFAAINGDTVTSQANSTWVLDLTYAQDFATATSLANYLHANEGKSKSATFVPNTGGPTITATLVIAPGAIGDAAGSIAQSKVSLGSTKPVITPAAT